MVHIIPSESHLQSCAPQLVRGPYIVEENLRMTIVKQRVSALPFRQGKEGCSCC